MSRYFGQFLPPLPLSHFVTHPGTPKSTSHISDPLPIFSRPSTKNPDKSPLYKFSLNCSQGLLSGGFCQRVFCLEGFVRGWLLSVPPSQGIFYGKFTTAEKGKISDLQTFLNFLSTKFLIS